MSERYAIVLDGEWVKKTLQKMNGGFPDVTDVMAEVDRIKNRSELAELEIYRVFFYTADPLTGDAENPLDGYTIDFAQTDQYRRNKRLIDKIETQPDVAVRRGTLTQQGWKIGRSAFSSLTSTTEDKDSLEGRDLVPNIQQKGVDMRIGLDLASLALKRLVGTVVLVTGDSDLVPAMKLIRTEGLRVFLDTLGSPYIRPQLKQHADRKLHVG